ncbi:MotA/TolQ/ExbB proton channel family protein [Dethiothermospora halolimnae]|uniref:MotA/TolQ/ExbB proton channel family protein n=1 Tax=Dethiothermospora halolimnae TaxID=3114390 RepID=UPI003CCBB356
MISLFDKLNTASIVIIGFILAILAIAVVANIVIKIRYRKVGHALNGIKKGHEDGESNRYLGSIVKDYKLSAGGNVEDINTQAIIEKHFNNEYKGLQFGQRFVNSSISLMIILGLLGTFYGLTLSISDLVQVLASTDSGEVLNGVSNIVGGLIESIKGMSVAFITSLCGIASSIVMTLINIFFSIEQTKESVMVNIEEYLDNVIALKFARTKKSESAMVVDELKNTFEDFGGSIEKNLEMLIGKSVNNLAVATKEIETSATGLIGSINTFDKAIDKFNHNTRDFSEFNHHLKTNIDRMNVAFADFTEEMKTNTKNIRKDNEVFSEISVSLDKLSKKIDN